MKRRSARASNGWMRGIIGLILSVAVLSGIAGPALAAAPSGHRAAAVSLPMGRPDSIDTSGSKSGRGACTNTANEVGDLPVTRWTDGMDFHDRLHSMSPGDIAKNMQRQGLVSFMFSVGNMMWTWTTGFTEMAINFCVLDKVGGLVDNVGGSLGHALLNSGLVAIFMVLAIFAYLYRIGRGAGGGAGSSGLFQKVLIIGLLAIMTLGASASTGAGAGKDPDAPYKPGVGSPGWVVQTIDTSVSAAANSLAGTLDQQSIDGAESGVPGRSHLGCGPYVKAMKDIYDEKYTSGGGFNSDANATVPKLLSSIWETSGLEMWKQVQFGNDTVGTYTYKDSNGIKHTKDYSYGDLMYCRLLEQNILAKRWPTPTNNTSVTAVMDKTGAVQADPFGMAQQDGDPHTKGWQTDGDTVAWRYSSSNKITDRALIGWAACSAPSGEGNVLVHKSDGEAASDAELTSLCKQFFTDEGWDGGGGKDEFDWDESNDDISADAATQAQDFLLVLHGNRVGAGMASGVVYMISSLCVFLVFALFSCAIMIAKVAALTMMLGVFLTLVICLLPNSNMSKLVDLLKQYIGLSVFAWGAQLVMSLIALLTSVLVSLGAAVMPGGSGSIMAIAWVGFSPLLACFCLHMVFKKMRIPSPMKMSGGMAWGQLAASGAVAGAAGFGAGALATRGTSLLTRGALRKSRAAIGSKIGAAKGSGAISTMGTGKRTEASASAPESGSPEQETPKVSAPESGTSKKGGSGSGGSKTPRPDAPTSPTGPGGAGAEASKSGKTFGEALADRRDLHAAKQETGQTVGQRAAAAAGRVASVASRPAAENRAAAKQKMAEAFSRFNNTETFKRIAMAPIKHPGRTAAIAGLTVATGGFAAPAVLGAAMVGRKVVGAAHQRTNALQDKIVDKSGERAARNSALIEEFRQARSHGVSVPELREAKATERRYEAQRSETGGQGPSRGKHTSSGPATAPQAPTPIDNGVVLPAPIQEGRESARPARTKVVEPAG